MPLESSKTPTLAVILAARQVVNTWNTSGGLRLHKAGHAIQDLELALDRLPAKASPDGVPESHWVAFLNTVEAVIAAAHHELKVAIRALAAATDLVSVDRTPPVPEEDPAAAIHYRPGVDD